tara:strand:- start:25 stop:399 length:375 start_codon:yes stop_codon:yes gene_type:complete
MAQLVQEPNIGTAIRALDSSSFYNIVGAEPTTEAEYKERVTFYTDRTGKTTKSATVTWSAVKAKYDELLTAYTNNDYGRKRVESYDTVGEQLDKLYHDIDAGKLDKTGTWFTSVKAVKDANPKP